MKTVNIAMLGSGFAAGLFMEGLENVNGQQVAVNYSRSADRARAFSKRWGIAQSSTDLDGIIARDDIDLFVIALPNEEHETVSLKLAAAEQNQVCTKPLGRNRSEAKRMFAAARVSGRMHGYAETEVFAPAVVKARQTIEGGGIGRVLWVRSREAHSGPHSAHFWDIDKTGGGAMSDLGCHCIEAARYFFGKEDDIVEVMAWGDRLVHHERTRRRGQRAPGAALCERRHRTLRAVVDHQGRARPAQRGARRRGLYLHRRDARRGDQLVHQPVRGLRNRKGRHRFRLDARAPGGGIQLRLSGRDAALRRVRAGRFDASRDVRDGYFVNCVLDAGYESMRERRWVRVEY